MSKQADDPEGSSTENLDTFCAYGFHHINIVPDGKASLCCRATGKIALNGRELSLHHDTFNDIWNSGYMRDVRRRMVSGRPVAACAACYREERQGGRSLRAYANAGHILGAKSLNEVYEDCREIVCEHDAIAPAPISIHLWLGNLCNLKCRMCSPTFSSQIAADPLHSRWSLGDGGLARKVTLLPDLLEGVEYQGFAGLVEMRDGVDHRLLSHEHTAVISLANSGDPIRRIDLSGVKDDAEPCTLVVTVGTDHVIRRSITHRNWVTAIFCQPPIECSSTISIGLCVEGVHSSVGIRNLSLTSAPQLGKAFPREFASRVAENPNWFDNEDVLIKEILGHPERIRSLNFAGGEPMLHSKLAQILTHLIEKGLAKTITLYFTTNGTVRTPQISALLKEFAGVGIGVSVDGLDELQEYIRPPSKWSLIRDNVFRYVMDGLGRVSIQPTPQAYNLFGLLDLVRWCDKHNIDFTLNNVLYYPPYLSFDMLPQTLVDEALAEWERYLGDGCRSHLTKEVDTVIGALKRPRPANQDELQKDFVKFTRDLDQARAQSLESASPRLYQRLADQGIVV